MKNTAQQCFKSRPQTKSISNTDVYNHGLWRLQKLIAALASTSSAVGNARMPSFEITPTTLAQWTRQQTTRNTTRINVHTSIKYVISWRTADKENAFVICRSVTVNFELWPWPSKLTYIDWQSQDEPACQISRSNVIEFKKYCLNTHTPDQLLYMDH